jgi:hypothetical protein
MTRHETSQPSARKDGLLAGLCSGLHNLGAALILAQLMLTAVCSAHAQIEAAQITVAPKPYMGWSTWSLQDKFDSYPGAAGGVTGEAAGDGFQNEWNIKAQSDAMKKSGLQAAGFEYINIDGDWDNGLLCQCGAGVPITWDTYGRPQNDPVRFPHGMAALAAYIHANGQKAGIYWQGGVPPQVYAANTPILGTSYTVQEITKTPLVTSFNSAYEIDFTKPGAQEYVNSLISLFAGWGYDYLKIDGVGSSVQNGMPEDLEFVRAVHLAVQKAGRPMYVNLSQGVDHNYAYWWERYSNGRRINGDIECSSSARRPNANCAVGSNGLPPLTDWANAVPVTNPATPPSSGVVMRFTDFLPWQNETGINRGWIDFDSLEVGNGTNTTYPASNKEYLLPSITPAPGMTTLAGRPSFVDGLTNDERKTAVTLWSIAGSALQLGDDMTNLDAFGISILTNPEVIAVDQSGRHGNVVYVGGISPIVSATPGNGTTVNTTTSGLSASNGVVTPTSTVAIGGTPVIEQTLCDGSMNVALFNTTSSPETVTVKWVDLGFSGSADVRDLWAREDLGVQENEYSVTLNPHASSLVHVKPVLGTLLTPDLLDDACTGEQ